MDIKKTKIMKSRKMKDDLFLMKKNVNELKKTIKTHEQKIDELKEAIKIQEILEKSDIKMLEDFSNKEKIDVFDKVYIYLKKHILTYAKSDLEESQVLEEILGEIFERFFTDFSKESKKNFWKFIAGNNL